MNKSLFVLCCFLATSSQAQITYQEHLIIGTGEYAPSSNWHALLQFDRADTMHSTAGNIQYNPSSTIPIRQCVDNGVNLNFAHGFYHRSSSDELYVATIFTNAANILTTNPDTAVGSIAVFDDIRTLNGAQVPSRHIFGDSTQLKQPHGCWVDESRDLLYVANTFGESVLIFHQANSVNGNKVPNQVIPISGRPVYVYVDEQTDRLFVAVMPNGMPGVDPKVEIFNNASMLNGAVAPNIRISGSNTRFNIGNMTTHNVWFRADKQMLAVGHHTNELLLFDLSTLNWSSAPTQNYNLSPKVVYVVDTALGIHPNDINLYGFYWDVEFDRMYCSVGIDNPGGGPMPGSPPSSIKIFDNISDPLTVGVVTASREIMWGNANTYYPPQPIWLIKTQVTANKVAAERIDWKIYPQPSRDILFVDFGTAQAEPINWQLINSLGQVLDLGQCTESILEINIKPLSPGRYFLEIQNQQRKQTSPIIIH